MGFLRSYWVLAILSVVVCFGLAASLFLKFSDILVPLPEQEPEVTEEEAMAGYYWSFRTQGIDKLVEELEQTKITLGHKEAELAKVEAQIRLEMEELQRLRSNIEALRTELGDYITQVADGEAKNLKELAATYTNMAPADVAEVFGQMDDTAVVKILSYMKPDAIAPIFAVMARSGNSPEESAKRVADISEKIRLKAKKV